MAKTIKFSGSIQSIESVGATVEMKRVFDFTDDLTEAACNYYDIPASTVDSPIPFIALGGTVPVVMVYINPSSAVSVKLEGTGSTAFTLNAGPSIFNGPLTAMYVTTSTEDVKVDVIVFG